MAPRLFIYTNTQLETLIFHSESVFFQSTIYCYTSFDELDEYFRYHTRTFIEMYTANIFTDISQTHWVVYIIIKSMNNLLLSCDTSNRIILHTRIH